MGGHDQLMRGLVIQLNNQICHEYIYSCPKHPGNYIHSLWNGVNITLIIFKMLTIDPGSCEYNAPDF